MRRVSHLLQSSGVQILSTMRQVSLMGVALTTMTILLLATVWTAAKITGQRRKLERAFNGKIVARYIETGDVSRCNCGGNGNRVGIPSVSAAQSNGRQNEHINIFFMFCVVDAPTAFLDLSTGAW